MQVKRTDSEGNVIYNCVCKESEENQTAVEWFFEQLTEVDYNCINKTFLQNDKSLAGYKMRELFEQAKEMEREQNQLWWSKGWWEGHMSTLQENTETFKSE
jgi:hypothetical protein